MIDLFTDYLVRVNPNWLPQLFTVYEIHNLTLLFLTRSCGNSKNNVASNG